MTNKTKQLKIVRGNVYSQFSDAPTRTEIRQLINDYMSGNKGVNGSELALGLADMLEQATWRKVPWTGYTPTQARLDCMHRSDMELVSDDHNDGTGVGDAE